MNNQEINAFILEKYNQFIKFPFNEFVNVMKNQDIEGEKKLADVIYTMKNFVENTKPFIELMQQQTIEEMTENGVTGYKTDNVSVSLVDAVPSCIITDAKEFATAHPELMSPPKPNKIEVAKRLRQGHEITGATLTNGGPPHLRISAIKIKRNLYAQGTGAE